MCVVLDLGMWDKWRRAAYEISFYVMCTSAFAQEWSVICTDIIKHLNRPYVRNFKEDCFSNNVAVDVKFDLERQSCFNSSHPSVLMYKASNLIFERSYLPTILYEMANPHDSSHKLHYN